MFLQDYHHKIIYPSCKQTCFKLPSWKIITKFSNTLYNTLIIKRHVCVFLCVQMQLHWYHHLLIYLCFLASYNGNIKILDIFRIVENIMGVSSTRKLKWQELLLSFLLVPYFWFILNLSTKFFVFRTFIVQRNNDRSNLIRYM